MLNLVCRTPSMMSFEFMFGDKPPMLLSNPALQTESNVHIPGLGLRDERYLEMCSNECSHKCEVGSFPVRLNPMTIA